MISKDTPLKIVLEHGKKCDKSGHCCTYSGGFVLDEDIPRIAKHLGMTGEEFREKCLEETESFNTRHFKLRSNKEGKPYGPCIFLRDNLCSIHEVKPLHCRVGSCCHEEGEKLSIWFALNHFVNVDDPESIRQWAVYLKTHPTIPGGSLKELVPDGEKLKNILSYEILNDKTMR